MEIVSCMVVQSKLRPKGGKPSIPQNVLTAINRLEVRTNTVEVTYEQVGSSESGTLRSTKATGKLELTVGASFPPQIFQCVLRDRQLEDSSRRVTVLGVARQQLPSKQGNDDDKNTKSPHRSPPDQPRQYSNQLCVGSCSGTRRRSGV